MSIQSRVTGLLVLGSLMLGTGCNAIWNGWLDPTQVGAFGKSESMEIRRSLSAEDTPPGIMGAVYPTKEDLEIYREEYELAEGDQVQVEIFELRLRNVLHQSVHQINHLGMVNIPKLGWIEAAGFTPREFEQRLVDELRVQQLLVNPEVTVTPGVQHNATYSIFGIGASASTNAQLRAGTWPLDRPDVTILEAINRVGGLNEFVTDVYIFRHDRYLGIDRDTAQKTEPAEISTPALPEVVEPQADDDDSMEPGSEMNHSITDDTENPQREIIEAVVGDASEETESQSTPKPTSRWIWGPNDEFIPNPDYQTPDNEQPEPIDPFEGPTVNWARVAGDSTLRVIRVPAQALRTGDPEFNIVVRPGDVIRIVSGEIGLYYVMGQVARPGAFGFNSEEITLKRAIALAGGLAALAWPDRCTIYRRIGQREQIIPVNLDAIFAGEESDFLIRRGDIINVGTHPFAPFLQRIRAWTLPSPANTVGYSFVYSRNFADIDSYGAKANPANQPDRFQNLFP